MTTSDMPFVPLQNPEAYKKRMVINAFATTIRHLIYHGIEAPQELPPNPPWKLGPIDLETSEFAGLCRIELFVVVGLGDVVDRTIGSYMAAMDTSGRSTHTIIMADPDAFAQARGDVSGFGELCIMIEDEFLRMHYGTGWESQISYCRVTRPDASAGVFVGNIHRDREVVEGSGAQEVDPNLSQGSEFSRCIFNLSPEAGRSLVLLDTLPNDPADLIKHLLPTARFMPNQDVGRALDAIFVGPYASLRNKLKIVTIPPRDGDTIHRIEFDGSRIIHKWNDYLGPHASAKKYRQRHPHNRRPMNKLRYAWLMILLLSDQGARSRQHMAEDESPYVLP